MSISNFNILFFLLVVFAKTSFSQGCDSNGLACISCTEYRKCIGGYPEGNIISCENRSVCIDDELKRCQMKLNCYAANECTKTGIFPDVMVDSNYFVCLSDGGSGFLKYEFSCPEENFFDKSSLACSPRSLTSTETTDPNASTATNPTSPPISTPSPPITTPSPPITTPSPPITTPSPPITTPSPPITTPSPPITTPSPPITTPSPPITTPSPPITTPSPPITTPSPPITTPSPPITTPSPPITTPSPPITTPPFTCPTAGIFPNPDNCKMYYRCSTSLKVFFYICPGTSYFNENILKCSLVITPTCQEQILKNSTSTTTTISSTITPAKTTPKLTTTSTSTTPITPLTKTTTTTTTTTSTTSATTAATTKAVPFSCLGSGTFENPLDCKTYFRCSISGQIFRYVCPGDTYFNDLTKRCTLAMTPRCRNLQG